MMLLYSFIMQFSICYSNFCCVILNFCIVFVSYFVFICIFCTHFSKGPKKRRQATAHAITCLCLFIPVFNFRALMIIQRFFQAAPKSISNPLLYGMDLLQEVLLPYLPLLHFSYGSVPIHGSVDLYLEMF